MAKRERGSGTSPAAPIWGLFFWGPPFFPCTCVFAEGRGELFPSGPRPFTRLPGDSVLPAPEVFKGTPASGPVLDGQWNPGWEGRSWSAGSPPPGGHSWSPAVLFAEGRRVPAHFKSVCPGARQVPRVSAPLPFDGLFADRAGQAAAGARISRKKKSMLDTHPPATEPQRSPPPRG